jgi:hypothetical protein
MHYPPIEPLRTGTVTFTNLGDISAFVDLKQSSDTFGRMICDQFDVPHEDGTKTG